MKSIALSSFALLAVVAVLVLASYHPVEPAKAAGFSGITNIGNAATTTANFTVTTSARVLATTSNPLTPAVSYTRVYATICNPNANPVALNMDSDKAANALTGNVTTWIAAAAGYNTCYEIRDYNQYVGSITASSSGETSTRISVKDYVQ